MKLFCRWDCDHFWFYYVSTDGDWRRIGRRVFEYDGKFDVAENSKFAPVAKIGHTTASETYLPGIYAQKRSDKKGANSEPGSTSKLSADLKEYVDGLTYREGENQNRPTLKGKQS